MWSLKKLYIKNWLSFQEQEYEFINNKPILIQGINLDDDSSESNGSGKSSLQEAIHYLITGNSIRKLRDLKLIRNGEDSTFISLILVNTISNNILVIERELFVKGSGKLKILLNESIQSFASINDGNNLIIQFLGISVEDIQNYFIINKERYKSFFSTSDNDKKKLIGRFSNAEKVLDVESHILEDLKVQESQKQKVNNEIIALEAKIQVYQEELDNMSEEKLSLEYEVKTNEIIDKIEGCFNNIEGYNTQIKSKEYEITNKETEKATFETQVKENEKILTSLEDVKFDEEISKVESEKLVILNEKTTIITNKTELESSIDELKQFLRELNNSVNGAIKCPKCLHEFVVGEDVDIEVARESIPEVESEIENINTQISFVLDKVNENNFLIKQTDDKIKSYQLQINEFNQKKRNIQSTITAIQQSINNTNNEIEAIKGKIVNFKALIVNQESYIESFNKDIDNLKEKDVADKKLQLEDKIAENETILLQNRNLLTFLDQEILDLNVWILNFKKFYSYLSNKSLSVIEGYSNLYLEKMRSPFQIKLEGCRVLSDGKLKENITPIIYKDDWSVFDYNQLSGGQRGKIDLSIVIALQTLINLNSSSGGLNLLWVDEATESIDRKGHINIIESLKCLSKTIFITTHVNIDNNQDTLTVKYENGVSQIMN